MRCVFRYIRWGMGQRLCDASFRFAGGVSSVIATRTTSAAAIGESGVTPSVMLTVRRHIVSFKGTPQEFIEEVNREKTAIVYFYTKWCEPCNRLTAKLQRLAANGASKPNSENAETSSAADVSSCSAASPSSCTTTTTTTTTTISSSSSSPLSSSLPSSSPSSPSPSSCSISSSSCCCSRPSLKADSQPSDAGADAESKLDAEVVLNNAGELCFPTRVNGETVRILPVDTDVHPKLGALHDIRSIPTLIAYRGGRIVGRVEGSSEQELRKLVHDLIQDNERDTAADSKAAGK